MKQKYIELMTRALSAYTDEHINSYFQRVQTEGLTEHGFPRLTANIGILISHDIRTDLLPLFCHMMDFCCEQIPRVKAANDFSVREIVFCLLELERMGKLLPEIEKWKTLLLTIVPENCYNKFATKPDEAIGNWALFSALSEFARMKLTGCDSEAFIELQLENQLHRLDENGMYCDNLKHDAHQPIIYDLVPRYLFCILMHFGYNGKQRERIDSMLKSTALMTLSMQSVTGEVAFGGRSNQFVHNEGMLAIIFEYEANRYAREGNPELAGKFKAAIARAMQMTEYWLEKAPIRHIKNRFSTETKYGCENYAYFDKYMITTASHIFSAYMLCNDEIETGEFDDSPATLKTSARFHKLFLRAGGYFAEFDTDADTHYDISGLGRVHRRGAPSPICLSLPCTSSPRYTIDLERSNKLSLCPALCRDGRWELGTSVKTQYELKDLCCDDRHAEAQLVCTFESGEQVEHGYSVSNNGVDITVRGEGEIGYFLPAFVFDGETETQIKVEQNTLEISYLGWVCRYSTSAPILELDRPARNRNGHYRSFMTQGMNEIKIKIEIVKA